MKKFVLLIASAILFSFQASAFDIKLLANNKETVSREIYKNDLSKLSFWKRQHGLTEEELKKNSLKALSDTFNEMEKIDTTCDIGLVDRLLNDAKKHNVISDANDFNAYIVYLRVNNLIDDILYRILIESNNIKTSYAQSAYYKAPPRPFNALTTQNAHIDVKKLYAPFKTFPDDVKNCSLDAYFNLTRELSWKTAKDRDMQLQKLNYLAYRAEAIDLATYNKLELLKNRRVLEWNIYFKRYADIVNNVKDKLAKSPEQVATHDFTVEYVSRRDKVTNRVNLYRTYDSTQIMILAQIIEKTAKRMDARRVSVNWQYTEDPNGEGEIYVFSPMEQYRAAVKMLRKDMAEVMRSDAFKNTGLQFDHIVAAAYEAGFIKSEELNYVLKFEDFWNPKIPKWKAYSNFAMSIAGTAVFYLPPPYSILGALGLAITQTVLANGGRQPDPDDNWNVII